MEFEQMLYVGAGAFGLAIINQFVSWLRRRWDKIEDNSEKAISREEVQKMITAALVPVIKENAELKKDLKAMAESMLSAVEKQEARQDQLVMHLLNDRGNQK